MRSFELTLSALLLAGFTVLSCQSAEDDELEETAEAPVVAVPDTSPYGSSKDQVALTNPGEEPEKEIVVVREEPAPQPPRQPRRATARPVVEDEPEPIERPRELPREEPRLASATVPSGTNFFVTTETELSTRGNQVGDPVAARTAENINVNGQVVIPAGALVEGHVTAVESAGNPGEIAYIDLAFDRVRLASGEWLPISGVLAGKAGEEVRGSANIPRNVAIGAGAGAVLGQVIGGDTKSTVIGAVIGAGAGAAAGEATRDTYVVVPAGSRINVQLTSAARVPLT